MGKGSGNCDRPSLVSIRSSEIDWDAQPLGEVSDIKIAKSLGVWHSVVGKARRARGIPSTKEKRAAYISSIDWDNQPLGLEADATIGKKIGVGGKIINDERKKRGIPSYRETYLRSIDWDNQPLGETEDKKIAEHLGVCNSSVQEQRLKRKIPAFTDRLKPENKWWDDKQLGSKPDRHIAKELGLAATTVQAAREHRNIQIFSGGLLTQEGYPCDSQIEAMMDAVLHYYSIIHNHQPKLDNSKLVPDFQIYGGYIEVAGMAGYSRYDTKTAKKQTEYEQLGLHVWWLEPKDVKELYKKIDLPLNVCAAQQCNLCHADTRGEHGHCKSCANKIFSSDKAGLCRWKKACLWCGEMIGYNSVHTEPKYCPNPKKCRYEAQSGLAAPIDWTAVGLGNKPDRQIAKALGCKLVSVSNQRRKLGIPVYKEEVDWDAVGLGTQPDNILAEAIGQAVGTVRKQRQIRKIPQYKSPASQPPKGDHIEWDTQPLGKTTDKELSQRLHVPTSRIREERQKRDIGVCQPEGIDWDVQPLGEVSDMELGRRLGISNSVVGKARKARGIPPLRGIKSTRKPADIDWDTVDWSQSNSTIAEIESVDFRAVSKMRKQYER